MGRYIRFFNKDDEEFVGEIQINIDIETLQKKYNRINDPMLFYSYPIKSEDASFYLQFLGNYNFDFSNFYYYLEYA